MAFRKRIRRSYQRPIVSVIIPARNEEACLEACLESIVEQDGIPFEIIVVDDGSTDGTRKIAESFSAVRVMSAPPLPEGWCGKSNAVAFGARHARGDWFLFTDADTFHKPGSLARAVGEAEKHGADLLSYSPEQVVKSFWERAVMPVVFAELAETFKPREVSDPRSPAAAANGQYLLVRRHAYELIGGHASIAHTLLEDVDLARSIKEAGGRLHFRYGGEMVKTRMYRNFRQLREGWTKNLALLFPDARQLAAQRMLEFAWIAAALACGTAAAFFQRFFIAAGFTALAVALWTKFLGRIRKAHFGAFSESLAIFGLPIFAWLLRRSVNSYAKGAVTWKGRSYPAPPEEPVTKPVAEKV
ncbi:glycosyl transferase, family 2 [Candidatus Koribacter versatilis Ellin345]|uniref:Glycosyl transferase, family 2 n=1 Tax=Koribacter versatilis (strain Ellin345) TaxID=204669 RepID=Q1IPI8_KORVE|nr:glycosyltransferase family 2 protein [Candidatus Koribacter versatilis]ABF41212.1 glycosyl transferase, family 2 [Candidatus Koribacter versatilis Ellin345]